MNLATDLNWIVNLYRLGRRLEESLPTEQLFRLVLERLVDVFGAEDGSLAILDAEGRLVIGAALHLPAEAIGRAVGGEGCPLGYVIRTRSPLLLEGDIHDDPRFDCARRDSAQRMPTTAICWPLNAGDKLIGAMCLNRYASDSPFTRADLEQGYVLIELAGIVIDNHRLFHVQQRRIAEITQAKQALEAAQSQLVQSEKMASIGQLAAGVAHEINNPIGYVYSNINTLGKYLDQLYGVIGEYEKVERQVTPEALQAIQAKKQAIDYDYLKTDILDLIKESHDGLDRVRKIVLDLKDFSHAGNHDEWVWADLHAGLDSTLNVVWNEIKYKCEVVKQFGDVPLIHCLPSQLNQVFMNLLVNASHAIQDKGTITLRTGREDDGVFVEVTDTGCGIPPELVNRVFEPFFTTKPVGKGTGLGLSISYNVVRKHHGRIEVRSRVGEGTTFHVWLPVDPPVPVEGTPTGAAA